VEPSAWRSYARRSQIAFYATAGVAGVVLAAALSAVMNPVKGVILGLFAGALLGVLVALLIAIWPLMRVLWHWATEICIGLAVVAGTRALASVVVPWLAVLVALVLVAAPVAVGPVRRRLLAVAWCGIVPHRLRLCFAEFIRASNRVHRHSPPLVLVARPTPAGERVWVWLRPGLELADLEGKTGKLAVACWAGEVRVVRASRRFAALVRIDVTRRDPLTGLVRSPLAGLVPGDGADVPVSPGLPPLGLNLDDIPALPMTTGTGRDRPTRTVDRPSTSDRAGRTSITGDDPEALR
jgi:hypothetical protein